MIQMCEAHYEACHTAVRERGLGHLLSANATEAARRLKGMVESEELALDDYDPYLAMYFSAVDLFREDESFGDAGSFDEEHRVCPMCAVVRILADRADAHPVDGERAFIAGLADGTLEFAEAYGIAKPFTLEFDA